MAGFSVCLEPLNVFVFVVQRPPFREWFSFFLFLFITSLYPFLPPTYIYILLPNNLYDFSWELFKGCVQRPDTCFCFFSSSYFSLGKVLSLRTWAESAIPSFIYLVIYSFVHSLDQQAFAWNLLLLLWHWGTTENIKQIKCFFSSSSPSRPS